MRSLRIICLLLLVGGYAVSAQDNSGNKAAPTQRPSATPARVHHLAKRARIERSAVSPLPLPSPSPSTNIAATKRSSEDRPSYAEALHGYRHERHDRAWWHQHFTTIVLVGGGYYYWNAGYWCPAWGYNPAYEYYDYDGPIYT